MGDDLTVPILVLGLGNMLLQDDGVGLELLEALRDDAADDVVWVDGGTQGIALSGLLAGRRAALLLDAVKLGAAPGTVHVIDDPLEHRPPHAGGAHEANAGDLLAAAALVGDVPEHVVIVGIEPEVTRTGIGLSPSVRAALPSAISAARLALSVLREFDGRTATSSR